MADFPSGQIWLYTFESRDEINFWSPRVHVHYANGEYVISGWPQRHPQTVFMPIRGLVWAGHEHPFLLPPRLNFLIGEHRAVMTGVVLGRNDSTRVANGTPLLIEEQRLKVGAQVSQFWAVLVAFTVRVKLKRHFLAWRAMKSENVFAWPREGNRLHANPITEHRPAGEFSITAKTHRGVFIR